MITYLSLGENGRAGNVCYQYAALKALSLKNGYVLKIPNPITKTCHGQMSALQYFDIECEFLNRSEYYTIRPTYLEPDSMNYDPNFWNIPDNTNLDGYFQSTLYFKEFEKQIKKELTPKKEFLNKAKNILESIKEKYKDYEIVSLHLRRGDNMDKKEHNIMLKHHMYGKDSNHLDFNSQSGSYIQKSIEKFRDKKVKFLIFTGGKKWADDNSEDVMWCKQNFNSNDFIFSEGNSYIVDFAMIMQCDHNILSQISSFGWWAAYLNVNENPTRIAPLHYHPEIPEYTHRKGFYPEGYILL
jgi:hypothetical protein